MIAENRRFHFSKPKWTEWYDSSIPMRQGLARILKALAGIAGVVALLTPVAGMGIVVFAVSLIVAIIAGAIGFDLSDEEDQGGYWPKGPNSSGLG
jgi:hypothetical protein